MAMNESIGLEFVISVSLSSGCLVVVVFLVVDFQTQFFIEHELHVLLLALQVGLVLAIGHRDEGVDVDPVHHAD